MRSIRYIFLALMVMTLSVASVSYVAPKAPVPKLPANGALLKNYVPTLTWTAAVPAAGTTVTGYQLQVGLSSDFSYGVTTYNRPVSLKYKLPAALTPVRTYYWRVRAKNNLGQWSAWSRTFSFRTSVRRPVLVSPADLATPLTLRPEFDWNSTAGAQTFTLQIAQDCDFATKVVVAVTIKSSAYTLPKDLASDAFFCWRVRANNTTYGPGLWSAPRAFTSPNPPSIPILVAPVDDTLTNDNSPRLDWQTSSLPPSTVFQKYEVEIADTEDFKDYIYHRVVNTLAVLGDSEYQIPDETEPAPDMLPGAATYYWRVRAYNANGQYSSWSNVFTLNITVDRPKNLKIKPNPPLDPRPLFDWDDVNGAELYWITAYARGVFEPILDTQTRLSQYRPTTDLTRDADISWTVYAIDAHNIYGRSLDSDQATFHSANPPTTPKLIAPGLNILTTTTPTFRWSKSTIPAGTTFAYYQIQIAENATFTIGLISKNRVNPDRPSYVQTTPLNGGRTYYWRVRACNTVNQCSAWASTSYFRVP